MKRNCFKRPRCVELHCACISSHYPVPPICSFRCFKSSLWNLILMGTFVVLYFQLNFIYAKINGVFSKVFGFCSWTVATLFMCSSENGVQKYLEFHRIVLQLGKFIIKISDNVHSEWDLDNMMQILTMGAVFTGIDYSVHILHKVLWWLFHHSTFCLLKSQSCKSNDFFLDQHSIGMLGGGRKPRVVAFYEYVKALRVVLGIRAISLRINFRSRLLDLSCNFQTIRNKVVFIQLFPPSKSL